MNVYFIDPTYVKQEAWKPLMTYLKVKAAWSFFSKEELPESLYSIIKPYLKSSYSNQNLEKYENQCVYWLKAHFEKHIELITGNYTKYKDIPKEKFNNKSTHSAYYNIQKLDDSNCLILLKLKSSCDSDGNINTRWTYFFDLPTKIAGFCLNFLHKQHGHKYYQYQSSFITIDEYFTSTYSYANSHRTWNRYIVYLPDGNKDSFINCFYRGVNENSPEDFPIREVDGKKLFTRIRSLEGDTRYKELIKIARDTQMENLRDIQERERERAEAEDWAREVDEMNRAFWRECGESGSNCESWPVNCN